MPIIDAQPDLATLSELLWVTQMATYIIYTMFLKKMV